MTWFQVQNDFSSFTVTSFQVTVFGIEPYSLKLSVNEINMKF